MHLGSAEAIAKSRGVEQIGFWRSLTEHTAYDSFWQEQALDRVVAREPITVPMMMIVSGLFDQEDIYGGPALYRALSSKSGNDLIHLVLGPWNHTQGRREGRGIGPIRFEGDTATWFRRSVMQPFLDHYLKGTPRPDVPRVLAYETGANQWHRSDQWPRSCNEGCPEQARKLFLLPHGRLGLEAPASSDSRYDEYTSDPAKSVPYRPQPIRSFYAADSIWGDWLVDDQRFAASRPDVLVYQTEPLKTPLRLAGAPVAKLFCIDERHRFGLGGEDHRRVAR